METIHASCVATGRGGILLLGPSGSGKSDLALRLIDTGARLVADDRVVLGIGRGTLVASPPPALAGRMEVRGIGIVDLPWRAPVAVVLAVELVSEDPPRLPGRTVWRHRGIEVPAVAVRAAAASAAARVRLAARIAAADSGECGAEEGATP